MASARTAAARSPRPPALSPSRRRVYTGVVLAVPWLALLMLELALRLAGYGSSYPLFVPYPPHPEYLFANQEVAKRYFPAGPFTPTPELDFFRARKEPRTFRIVVQGESSAQGFPYGHGGAPSRMLRQRLQATFPDRRIEVINTALTAVNSYTLLDQANEIVDQHPDAVLIYTGHNEYYGVFGAASAQSLGHWRPLIEAYLALRRLRSVQLLANAMSAVAGAARTRDALEAPRTVMELMAGEQRIPLGSRRYAQGLAQFRANLGELLSRYRARGVPVFIGTVASNERDQPPLVSGLAPHSDSAAWWRSYRAALAALQRGDSSAAERALETAVRVDSTAADGFYALARLRDARGDYARARGLYRAAKDRDELRFRAPEAINQTIRDEAARHGAVVVETEAALERAAPGGIVGRTLMLEHLHPNIDGYFLIADTFYEALRAKQMIGPWTAPVPADRARREILVTPVDSLVAALRTDRLRSGWPFQPRGVTLTPIVDTLRPTTIVEQLAQAVVRGTLAWAIAMEQLRAYYERAGDYDRAIHVALAMAQEYDYSPQPYMDAGRLAILRHRYDEALRYVRAATERRETASSVQLVGLLLLRLGDHDAAMPYLRRAAALAPGDRRMSVALTAAEALPDLERTRAHAPRDTSALYNLAVAYALTQQYEKSREVLAALRRVAPGHAGARELLRRLPPDDRS
jgi:tetratricopeptide (TPR) repeat protein